MNESLDQQIFFKLRQVKKELQKNCTSSDPQVKKVFHRNMILMLLAEKTHPVRQGELLDDIMVSPSTLSEMVSKLEREGYIRKVQSKKDKRTYLLWLTEEGQRQADHEATQKREQWQGFFGKLDPQDKRDLIGLLDKLIGDEGYAKDI